MNENCFKSGPSLIQLPKKGKRKCSKFQQSSKGDLQLTRRKKTQKSGAWKFRNISNNTTRGISSSKFLLETRKVGGVSSLVSIFLPHNTISLLSVRMLCLCWHAGALARPDYACYCFETEPPPQYHPLIKRSFPLWYDLGPPSHTFLPHWDLPLNGESWTSNTPRYYCFTFLCMYIWVPPVCVCVAFK